MIRFAIALIVAVMSLNAVVAAAPLDSSSQPPLPGTNAAVMKFIERATSTGQGGNGRLFLGRLPDVFPSNIPLPDNVSLVGSIQRPNPSGQSMLPA